MLKWSFIEISAGGTHPVEVTTPYKIQYWIQSSPAAAKQHWHLSYSDNNNDCMDGKTEDGCGGAEDDYRGKGRCAGDYGWMNGGIWGHCGARGGAEWVWDAAEQRGRVRHKHRESFLQPATRDITVFLLRGFSPVCFVGLGVCAHETKPEHVSTSGNAFCSALLLCTAPWLLSLCVCHCLCSSSVFCFIFLLVSNFSSTATFPLKEELWILSFFIIYCLNAISSISFLTPPECFWQVVNIQREVAWSIINQATCKKQCWKEAK